MKKTLALTLAAGLTVSLASCGSEGSTSAIEVDNCGDTVHLDGPPENVTLLKSASVPTLQHLGVLDRVKNRAGKYPTAYYDDATNDALAAIPSLTDKTDASGHLQISREEVVATGPDLVLGETDTVNRQTLASSDVPLIEEPAFCGSLERPVTWHDAWDQIRLYGTVFDRGAEAEEYVTALQDRLASIEDAATPTKPDGSPYRIAVLYPTVGGGVTYAYGTGSMAAPVVEAAGAENVYADQSDRVFEVTAEDIVDRNPDVVLALYSDGSADEIVDAVKGLPGMDRTTAGQRGQVLPLLLNYAEPPTPLAVDGLEQVDDYLRDLPDASGAAAPDPASGGTRR